MENTIIDKDLKKQSIEKRKYNIDKFSSLDKTNLEFGNIERRLNIKNFNSGEKLYIQYPGKESIVRGTRNPRPWDFRPKLLLPNNNFIPDLSFKDIWDDLYNFKNFDIDMSNLAVLLFRMAYMIDHKLITRNLAYQDISSNGDVINEGVLDFTYYEYCPESRILDELSIPSDAMRGAELYSYLTYNDLLAQNEDCKYYYRDEIEKGKKWKSDIGRRNTLLTHVSIIGFIEEKIKFTEITDMFQRGLGVAPIPKKYWAEITNNIIS